MVISTAIGTALVGYSGYRIFFDHGEKRLRKVLQHTFEDCDIQVKNNFPKIKKVKKTDYGYKAIIEMPNGYPVKKFFKQIDVLQESTASEIQHKHLYGRNVELDFGMYRLYDQMYYTEDNLDVKKEYGRIVGFPVYTAFGIRYVNFWDEATCHFLIGGATRMGKSVLIRLLFVHIMRETNGNVQFVYINNKVEDHIPFEGIPQIPYPAETIEQAAMQLTITKKEIERRKTILRENKCVNAQVLRKKHPDIAFDPLFIVVDEYGRFAEDKDEPITHEIQKMITEISETAGYLDVHLVVATQRPDAQSVLKPRIRQNMLASIAFQTRDESNSEIIVGVPDAAHLGRVKGRAVLVDGLPAKVQIPYISDDEAQRILDQFRVKEVVKEDEIVRQRQDDPEVSESLSSNLADAIRNLDLSRSFEPYEDDQSDNASFGA